MSLKILVCGLPRMGTQSLADALQHLGYDPMYHMREVGKNEHQTAWVKLIETKAEGRSDQLTREDFEVVLKNFQVRDLSPSREMMMAQPQSALILTVEQGMADFPASIFGEELIREYPEAKVIIPIRSEEAWYKSMLSTLWHGYTRPDKNLDSPMWPLCQAYHKFCWDDDFENCGKPYFRRYYSRIEEVAPAGNTLHYTLGDGWQPLCDFLGVAVPDIPFPQRDDLAPYKVAV